MKEREKERERERERECVCVCERERERKRERDIRKTDLKIETKSLPNRAQGKKQFSKTKSQSDIDAFLVWKGEL